MNVKSEKGVSNIDITISLILITLFISIIATLIYNINSTSKTMERRAEAINYAINTIEELKSVAFDDIEKMAIEKDIEDTGYHQKIVVEDYAELEKNSGSSTIEHGYVKKVTVIISYMEGKNIETVDLSTVITKTS